ARTLGLARPWGEVLNELSDRVADVALIGGLALASPANLLLGTGALVAMLLSSYLAILSKAAGGRRQYMGPMGKADRMVLLAVGAPLGFVLPLDWVYGGILALLLVGRSVSPIQTARGTQPAHLAA